MKPELIFCFVLALNFVLPAVAQAQFRYTTNSGSITITKYIGSGGVIIIPNTINGLSVTSIGPDAFMLCTNLSSVTIPNSVTSIGHNTFMYCDSLTNVTIPNSVTNIGDAAFLRCHGLSSITIPDSVTSIGKTAFAVCPRLTGITVDKLNSSYSSVAGVLFNKDQTALIQYHSGGKAGSYTIPDGVTTVGTNAFTGCSSLTNVVIPNSVINIGDGAFALCTNLTSVTMPNSVTNIGDFAFMGCPNVTIPKSATHVGNQTPPEGL